MLWSVISKTKWIIYLFQSFHLPISPHVHKTRISHDNRKYSFLFWIYTCPIYVDLFSIGRLDTERFYLMIAWPLPQGTSAEPRTLLVHIWRVFAWKTVLRKIASLLWGNRMRINIFCETYTAPFLFRGQRFDDRFPFHLQEVVSAVHILPLFHFRWCVSTSGQTVERPNFLLRFVPWAKQPT